MGVTRECNVEHFNEMNYKTFDKYVGGRVVACPTVILKKKSYAKESVTHVGCYCPQMGKPFIG